MTYSKKATPVDNNYSENTSNIDWAAFNQHLLEVVNESIKKEGKNQVCILSGIVDSGKQYPQDKYTTYPSDENDPRQKKLLDANFGCFHEDGKFHIPQKPADSVIFFVDFPSILVNYGKFFSESGEDDFKPYRTLLAGEWEKIAQVTVLSPDPEEGYGPLSRIHKIANAIGLVDGNPPTDFDIGSLLGGVFTMDISAEQNDTFVNIRVKNVGTKHQAIPVPEYTGVPFGISWEGGNDSEALDQVKRKKVIRKRLEMATDYEGSGLQKELEALSDTNNSPHSDNKGEGNTQATPEREAPTQEYMGSEGVSNGGIDFGDDIPFAPIGLMHPNSFIYAI